MHHISNNNDTCFSYLPFTTLSMLEFCSMLTSFYGSMHQNSNTRDTSTSSSNIIIDDFLSPEQSRSQGITVHRLSTNNQDHSLCLRLALIHHIIHRHCFHIAKVKSKESQSACDHISTDTDVWQSCSCARGAVAFWYKVIQLTGIAFILCSWIMCICRQNYVAVTVRFCREVIAVCYRGIHLTGIVLLLCWRGSSLLIQRDLSDMDILQSCSYAREAVAFW